MAFLRDVWNFDNSKNPSLFYNKFLPLNNFFDSNLATPEILKNMQIEVLKKSYLNKGKTYETLNNFLKKLMGDSQGTEDDLFAKLVQGINKGLDEFRARENKENKNWIQDKKNGIYYKQLDDIILELNTLVNSVSGEQGIPAPSLDRIKNAIGSHNKEDFIAAKGDFLEEIGTWIMIRAGLQGFTTGAWKAADSFFDETVQNSIIEDCMGLLFSDMPSSFFNGGNGNFLSVKIANYNQKSTQNKIKANKQLQNWVNSIKALNGVKVIDGEVIIGSNISSPEEFVRLMRLIDNNPSEEISLSVSLSSNLYNEINKLTTNIQAKSNVERHLTNNGLRSLYHMDPKDKYFNQLTNFNQTYPVKSNTAVTEEEKEMPYEGFAAYVNYNLSKNINNTIYGRNEFYLTVEGFADLATLMQKRGFYIRIEDSIISYNKFLNNSFKTIYS